MGRGKQRKKAQLKKKREMKRKRGIHVPFSLANSPKPFHGRKHKHEFKTNIHRLIFTNTTFENVKYTNANITNCRFRNTRFRGVDFIGTNLKRSNFRRAVFENVIFYNVNVRGANFQDATFTNTYFINTNLQEVKNLNTEQEGVEILKSNFEDVNISPELERAIFAAIMKNRIKKNYVLTTKASKGKKMNKAIIKILLDDFTENELIRSLNTISSKNAKQSRDYFTYHSFYEFLKKYLKKNGTIKKSGPGTRNGAS